MHARMYRNETRKDMKLEEFHRRVDCARKYETLYFDTVNSYTYKIETDNLTKEEVLEKVLKIVREN